MGAVLPFLVAAGSVVSAMGSIASGNAQAAAYRYNQQVEYVKAQEQLDASRAEAQQVEQQNKQKMGQIAAAYASAGVDSDTGTPLEVMHAATVQGELGRQLTLYRGKIGALTAEEQAALDAGQATAATQAGYARAGGTLLTGATNFLGPNGINIGAGGGGGAVDTGNWNF